MRLSPRIVYEQPNVENTVPVGLYSASAPEKFSHHEDDKFVLFAGGPSYQFKVLQNDPTQKVEVPSGQVPLEGDVSLFVLNTYLLIWFSEFQCGIEFPYQCVTLHALQDGGLYLQVLSSDIYRVIAAEDEGLELTVEILIQVGGGCVGEVNPLLYSPSSIADVFQAMSRCSALHFDDDDDDDNEAEDLDMGVGQWYTGGEGVGAGSEAEVPASWLNHGVADDLDESICEEEEGAGGMYVDVGYGSVAGTVRRGSEDEENEDQVTKRNRVR
ncbi:hypothetical protein CAAN1_08S02916 [[Candida] anglica]|uniref:Protein LOT5 n=1 Tax=[Candida] anglica TaxID=148631 RepID=A0ABP0E5U1_9ASCO